MYGTRFDRRQPFLEQTGVVYVRGCEVQGMLDEKGRVIEEGTLVSTSAFTHTHTGHPAFYSILRSGSDWCGRGGGISKDLICSQKLSINLRSSTMSETFRNPALPLFLYFLEELYQLYLGKNDL